MKTILSEELEELTIEESIKSTDQGIIIKPNTRGKELTELQKEIIGNDANIIGPSEAARIHGITQASASRYGSGQNMAPETAARVLDSKHEIRDLATTKLLQTLNLLDPCDVETKDLPRIAGTLSQIVERLEGKNEKGNKVELHLYAPQQKKISNFDIIDV